MNQIVSFIPSILSVIAIIMSIPLGVKKTQLIYTFLAFCGLLVLGNNYLHLEGARMINLPVIGAAVTFVALGLYIKRRDSDKGDSDGSK